MKRPLCRVGVLIFAAVWIAVSIRGPAMCNAVENGSYIEVTGTAVSRKCKSDKYIIEIKKPELKSDLKGEKSNKNKKIKIKGILVYLDTSEKCIPKLGQRIKVAGKAELFEKATNPGQFDMRRYRMLHGLDFALMDAHVKATGRSYNIFTETMQRIRERMVECYDRLYDENTAGVAKAMVLGDRSGLAESEKALYQAAGIAHILSISGLHIGVIGLGLYKLLKRARLKRAPAGALSMIFIGAYAQMTGGSASVIRAGVMLAMGIIAEVIGRKSDILSSMALSLIMLLISNPLLVYDSGFLLSFGAVSGIGIVSPVIKILVPKADSKWLSGPLASVSVSIFTLPIILYFFFQFPLYSLMINLIVVPLMGILLVLLIGSGLAGLLWLGAGMLPAWSATCLMRLIDAAAEADTKLPATMLVTGRPELWRIILYYFLLSMICFIAAKERIGEMLRIKSAVLFVMMLALMFYHPAGGLEIMSMDVGQGDSGLIRLDDTAFLIDCGSTDVKDVAKYRVVPCIRSQGIADIDYAVMTHPDGDHINGFMEIFEGRKYEGIRIKNFIMPKINKRDEAYERVRQAAEKYGARVIFIKAGDVIKSGKLTVRCIHPAEDYVPEDVNSYSTVLDIRYGKFSALFTGDVQGSGEEAAGSSCGEDYTLLKVAHHGSKNSSKEAFLKKTKPKYAFISCGKNNSYGHPHRETLERLNSAGSNIYVTKESGALSLYTDGKRIRIKTYE
ncbi:MAG: DNA internalization-related competence protein ComEC/Rec2 [Lachnospiraceae bacterium]|nr:DNA internalization-related competence protein ComEC/Rec2 [Lachnospiraceae bacterium]